jgi:hypothetical protein
MNEMGRVLRRWRRLKDWDLDWFNIEHVCPFRFKFTQLIFFFVFNSLNRCFGILTMSVQQIGTGSLGINIGEGLSSPFLWERERERDFLVLIAIDRTDGGT